MILTAVEKVCLNYGKSNQEEISKMTVSDAKKYLSENHFPAGSMEPKIIAAINFLEGGGKKVTITSIEHSVDAVNDKTGTVILND
jgi:carbamate kinase